MRSSPAQTHARSTVIWSTTVSAPAMFPAQHAVREVTASPRNSTDPATKSAPLRQQRTANAPSEDREQSRETEL